MKLQLIIFLKRELRNVYFLTQVVRRRDTLFDMGFSVWGEGAGDMMAPSSQLCHYRSDDHTIWYS